MKRLFWLLACLAGCAGSPAIGESPPAPVPAATPAELHAAVWARELAFAQTLADRDLVAFESFVAADAVFFGSQTLRGRANVGAGWSAYFESAEAPFSWRPDHVEVLASGDLALSTGPVLDPAGQPIGRFVSIWRLEGDTWRVVFDRGEGG